MFLRDSTRSIKSANSKRFVFARKYVKLLSYFPPSAARIPEIGIYSIARTFIRIKRRHLYDQHEGARRLMRPDENQACLFPRPPGFQLDLTDEITLFTRAHASSLLDWGSRVAIAALPATPGRRRDASRRYIRKITDNVRWPGSNVTYSGNDRSCNARVVIETSSAMFIWRDTRFFAKSDRESFRSCAGSYLELSLFSS